MLRGVRRRLSALQLRKFVRESDGGGGADSKGIVAMGSGGGTGLERFQRGISGDGVKIAVQVPDGDRVVNRDRRDQAVYARPDRNSFFAAETVNIRRRKIKGQRNRIADYW